MSIVKLSKEGAELKMRIGAHFRKLGFTKDESGFLRPIDNEKNTYRRLHEMQRNVKLEANKIFLERHAERLLVHFADGRDISPEKISPAIELIRSNTWQSDLFRFASLQWRIPVSQGYGRRMRFLVWDSSNGKLMGLIALGDPVFNMAARDQYVGWDHIDRTNRLSNIMDAYVLGAIPPYNDLLVGKLVASIIRSREIVELFRNKYEGAVGIISGEKKLSKLVMVTTTSALGRSSVYNRLQLGGVKYFKSVGYTGGWGHFHISDDLFLGMRAFLQSQADEYGTNNEFGDGPNWRLRAIRRTFMLLGMGEQFARHRLAREVFVSELADNAKQILRGEDSVANFSASLLSFSEVAELALNRWVIPRAARRPEFFAWNKRQLLADIALELPQTPMAIQSVQRH